jgi:hypothetical protein
MAHVCEARFVIKVAGFNDPIVFIFPAAVASTAGSAAVVGSNEAVALSVFVQERSMSVRTG